MVLCFGFWPSWPWAHADVPDFVEQHLHSIETVSASHFAPTQGTDFEVLGEDTRQIGSSNQRCISYHTTPCSAMKGKRRGLREF